MSRHVTPLILALCVQVASIHAADWPQFRGPNRDGQSPETGLLKMWPEAGPRLVRTITGAGGAQVAFGNSEPREPLPQSPERRGRSWLAQELAAGDGGDVAAEDQDGNGDVPETRVAG